jgi:hypothetical protein
MMNGSATSAAAAAFSRPKAAGRLTGTAPKRLAVNARGSFGGEDTLKFPDEWRASTRNGDRDLPKPRGETEVEPGDAGHGTRQEARRCSFKGRLSLP